jgi:hypothetical protein
MSIYKTKTELSLFEFLICCALIVAVSIFAISGSVEPNIVHDAEHLLLKQGYSQVEVADHKVLFGCGGDFINVQFKALDPRTKEPVEGYVCRGFNKGSTIRFIN